MNGTVFFQALSQAIFFSLVQALIIYSLTRLILSAFKDLSSSWRYNILYTSLLLICLAFLLNFFISYNPLNEVEDSSPVLLKQITASETLIPYSFWISCIYLVGLVFQTISLLAGMYRVETRSLKNTIPAPSFWSNRLEELKLEFGMLGKISLHFSDTILVPSTAGYIKPVILFPTATINRLSTQQVEAILLHELAHIKRNDYLMNIIQRVMEIILFFNPITWALVKQLKAEREFCCDELVLLKSPDPLSYARALALIEEYRVNINDLAMAANGHTKNDLLTRIKKITNMKTRKSNPQHRFLALIGVVAISFSIAWIIPADTVKVKARKDTTEKLERSERPRIIVPAPPVPPAELMAHPVPAPPAPSHPKIKLPPAPPAPPAPADTTELKKYFNSPEWKAQEKAIKKSAEEMNKYFNSPEWKSKVTAIEKSGKELEKKFNSPEWKSKMKDLVNLGAELDKKFNGPEWKEHIKRIEDHSAELEKKFNSPEWKEKMKRLEDHSKELEKKFNTPEWKTKMKDMESKKENFNTDTLK